VYVDLNRGQVTVLQDPEGETYQSEQAFTENDQLAPLCCPDVWVNLRYLIL
jgi:Uma2 family endonuclease